MHRSTILEAGNSIESRKFDGRHSMWGLPEPITVEDNWKGNRNGICLQGYVENKPGKHVVQFILYSRLGMIRSCNPDGCEGHITKFASDATRHSSWNEQNAYQKSAIWFLTSRRHVFFFLFWFWLPWEVRRFYQDDETVVAYRCAWGCSTSTGQLGTISFLQLYASYL
jgi:hypothetical protein